MMDFIIVPALFGVITLGIYKLFELFVCKKERLTVIEKMGDKFTPDMLEHKIGFSSIGNFSFSALKIGCLLAGMGLGLLVGFFVCSAGIPGYLYNDGKLDINGWDRNMVHEVSSMLYGASVLLFGGIGLLVAFVVELKLGGKKE